MKNVSSNPKGLMNRISKFGGKHGELCGLATALLFSSIAFADTLNLAGNWKGILEVGEVKLHLVFKIKQADSAWTAKMDSPDQGARDFPVDSVTLKDHELRMQVKILQGLYQGTVDKSGTKVAGTWEQGGKVLPLNLELSKGALESAEAEKFSPADFAASKEAAQKLMGTWNGDLSVSAAELRLVLHVTNAPSGAASATLDSPDQGATGIPLNAMTLKEGKVRFEARGLISTFEGALGSDGTTLKGEWKQAGQTMPLIFKKEIVKKK
jgi:hypothetical protein